jgi:uncharacterized protein (DUF1499 family)
MALASLALRTSNVTINNANVELRTTAGVIARVLEVSLIQATGTASSFGLGRPNAIGVTPGTTSTFQRDNSADPACVTTASLTWGTSPTAPTNYHRRWNSAATIGVGIIWTFPRALVVPVSSSLVVFNITASVALDVNMAIDE